MNLGFKADILLNNATVITLNPCASMLGFVALKGNHILAIGRLDEAKNFKSAYTKEIDCQTQCLIPGFTDSHCHLFALASSMRNINFQTNHIYSISELVNIISQECKTKQPGEWIRANGYDEFHFRDNRHPTRWDLDIASEDHPIRLDHRTGHASVLNTKALYLMGINKYTPDTLDGIIDRDNSGEPTGLVLEMANELRRRMPVQSNNVDYLTGIKMANRLLLSKGITTVQDAGIENDINRWHSFKTLIEQGHIVPKTSVMIGQRHFDKFIESGIIHDTYRKLSLGPVKLAVGLTTGSMQPDQKTLDEIVFRMHANNFQVAIHAIEKEAVKSALYAITKAQSKLPNQNIRHRIEHCSECPTQLLELFKRSGAVAVTHPAFIYHTGDKYISQIDDDMLSEIYPIASLLRSGITVASSSDSPVTYPDPFLDIYAAITRNTSSGANINISERLSVESALKLWTTNPAYVSRKENVTGNIMPGMLADLVLVDQNLFQVETETIKDIKVTMTIVDGNIEWES